MFKGQNGIWFKALLGLIEHEAAYLAKNGLVENQIYRENTGGKTRLFFGRLGMFLEGQEVITYIIGRLPESRAETGVALTLDELTAICRHALEKTQQQRKTLERPDKDDIKKFLES